MKKSIIRLGERVEGGIPERLFFLWEVKEGAGSQVVKMNGVGVGNRETGYLVAEQRTTLLCSRAM